jgi:hypothetical protein
MILALSEGSWGTIGLISVGLLLFAIKALIAKMISPVKDKQVKQDADMILMEQRLKSLEDDRKEFSTKLDAIPAQLEAQSRMIIESIEKVLKANERYYDSRYVHQKKQ